MMEKVLQAMPQISLHFINQVKVFSKKLPESLKQSATPTSNKVSRDGRRVSISTCPYRPLRNSLSISVSASFVELVEFELLLRARMRQVHLPKLAVKAKSHTRHARQRARPPHWSRHCCVGNAVAKQQIVSFWCWNRIWPVHNPWYVNRIIPESAVLESAVPESVVLESQCLNRAWCANCAFTFWEPVLLSRLLGVQMECQELVASSADNQ